MNRLHNAGRLISLWARGLAALAMVTAICLTAAPALAATGGSIILTPSTTSAAPGDLVDFTVSFSSAAGGATNVNSAGIILQWDKRVLALDASSTLGVANDNDPHATLRWSPFFGQRNGVAKV